MILPPIHGTKEEGSLSKIGLIESGFSHFLSSLRFEKMSDYRVEVDSMGEVRVPAKAYYSAQTQRAVENFPISGWQLPVPLLRSMGRVKLACAGANNDLGKLSGSGKNPLSSAQVDAMMAACQEVIDGKIEIEKTLIPQLVRFHAILKEKARAWDRVIKIGRTHLMDATPLRLGQEFGGFARQIELSIDRAKQAVKAVLELPVGGTAVGSGINTHPEFGSRVARSLQAQTGIPFIEAADHFEANSQRDGLVESHGQIKAIAMTLFNLSNNIRWLGSGPRCGFYEVILPDRQPGSSIMPGKVNPVMCESMMQLTARVMGNDTTMTMCGAAGGIFQLNIMMPIMGHAMLESTMLLSHGVGAFIEFCMDGLEANVEGCEASVEQSLSMVTSLNPFIGYEKAAKLTKEAFASGKTIRELCLEQNILPRETLDAALDPFTMTEPQA